MKQETLANWLKLLIVGVGICGIILLIVITPFAGLNLMVKNFDMTNCYMPLLVLSYLVAIPIYAALVFAWKIATNIGLDRSFSMDNAKYLKWIAFLAAGDTVFFFLVNVIYLVLGLNNIWIFLITLFLDFIGISIAVCTAGLSHLTMKSAQLQDDSDLTI